MKYQNIISLVSLLFFCTAVVHAGSYFTYATYNDDSCKSSMANALFYELDVCKPLFGPYYSQVYRIVGSKVVAFDYTREDCSGAGHESPLGVIGDCNSSEFYSHKVFLGKEPVEPPYALFDEFATKKCQDTRSFQSMYRLSVCQEAGFICTAVGNSVNTSFYSTEDCSGAIAQSDIWPMGKCVNKSILTEIDL